MGRNFAVLGKAASQTRFPSQPGSPSPASAVPTESESPGGVYFELARRLFRVSAAVALVGSSAGDTGESVSRIAEDLAAELADSGKRVVVVPFDRLLSTSLITAPAGADFMPGNVANVWIWPPSPGQGTGFFETCESAEPGNWLDALRRGYDAVLLDCPNVEGAPGVTEVAAMADAVVLAVEAGRTSKRQILEGQRALQLRGARLVGCILIERG